VYGTVLHCTDLRRSALSCTLQALVSVSVIGTQDSMSDDKLTAAVLKEMAAWFGPDQVATWSHLRTYR
jgi:hypothetical protein